MNPADPDVVKTSENIQQGTSAIPDPESKVSECSDIDLDNLNGEKSIVVVKTYLPERQECKRSTIQYPGLSGVREKESERPRVVYRPPSSEEIKGS